MLLCLLHDLWFLMLLLPLLTLLPLLHNYWLMILPLPLLTLLLLLLLLHNYWLMILPLPLLTLLLLLLQVRLQASNGRFLATCTTCQPTNWVASAEAATAAAGTIFNVLPAASMSPLLGYPPAGVPTTKYYDLACAPGAVLVGVSLRSTTIVNAVSAIRCSDGNSVAGTPGTAGTSSGWVTCASGFAGVRAGYASGNRLAQLALLCARTWTRAYGTGPALVPLSSFTAPAGNLLVGLGVSSTATQVVSGQALFGPAPPPCGPPPSVRGERVWRVGLRVVACGLCERVWRVGFGVVACVSGCGV